MRKVSITSRGFSLLELLVVIGIIALASVLVVGSVSGIGAARLSGAAQSVVGEIDLARQLAASANRPHEVRFWKYQQSGTSDRLYRAMQIFKINPDGTAIAAGRLKPFGDGLALNETEAASSLIGRAATTATMPHDAGASYVGMRFFPSGETDLNRSNRWFITLQETKTPVANPPPSNRATIEVEPVLGSPRLFRP